MSFRPKTAFFACWALWGLLGCGAEGSGAFVPVPDAVRGLIVAIETEGTLDVRARARTAGERILLDAPELEGRTGKIYVLGYDTELSALSLEAGVLEPAPPADRSARPLPLGFIAARSITVTSGAPSTAELLPLDVLPQALEAFLLPRATACPSLVPRELVVPPERHFVRLLELEGEPRVLAVATATPGPSRTELWTVEADGRLATHGAIDGLTAEFATGDARGRVWIQGVRDRAVELWTGPFDGPFEPLAPPPGLVVPLLGLTAARAPATPELYLFDGEGKIYRKRGDTWTLLWTRPEELEDARLGFEWAAPDEVFALVGDPRRNDSHPVLRLAGTEATLERLPSTTALTGLAIHPAFGIMAGSGRGFVYVRSGGVWRDLGPSPIGRQVFKIIPFGGGILASNFTGTLAIHHPESGYCPNISSAGPIGSLIDLVALGDGALAAASTERRGQLILLSEQR